MGCYCDYYSGEPPRFSVTKESVVARKQHECCECEEPIVVGEKHQTCSGLWDGGFRTYRTCLHCAALRNEADADDWSEGIAFGQLACWYMGVIQHEVELMDEEDRSRQAASGS